MKKTVELRELRTVLVRLYSDVDHIRRVTDDAQIDPAKIKQAPEALMAWHWVLLEAHKQGRIQDLLDVVLGEYPKDEQLAAAARPYRAHPIPDMPRQIATTRRSPLQSQEDKLLVTKLLRTSVDRDKERDLLAEMLQGQRREHVLLILAPGGMGKSTLIREFYDSCERHPRALLDLKLMTYTAAEILGELSSQLAEVEFHRFYSVRDRFATVAPDQMRQFLQPLTDAFFEDLSRPSLMAALPTVLFLDSHEKASQDVKDWLAGQFLPRVSRNRRLITVVAGQDTPQVSSGLQEWCLHHELVPLGPDDLREYARLMDLDLSEDVVLVLYHITKGIPLRVATDFGTLKAGKAREAAQHG